jgi:hypothetical protein
MGGLLGVNQFYGCNWVGSTEQSATSKQLLILLELNEQTP